MGWTVGVQLPAGERDVALLCSIQTSSRAHPVSYPMDTGGGSPWIKQPGCEADHSSSSGTEIKNGEAIPLLPKTSPGHSA
jgi:hypothetical protein